MKKNLLIIILLNLIFTINLKSKVPIFLPDKLVNSGMERFVGMADLNCDNELDFYGVEGDRVNIFFGNKEIYDTPDVTIDIEWLINISAEGDINGDNCTDLLVVTKDNALLFIGGERFDNEPDFIIPKPQDLKDGIFTYWSKIIKDLNGDNIDDLELITYIPFNEFNHSETQVRLYWGRQYFPENIQPNFTLRLKDRSLGPDVSCIGDINGDNLNDLVVFCGDCAIYNEDDLLIYYGSENFSNIPSVRRYVHYVWSGREIGDLNGDNYCDVVVASPVKVKIYLGGPEFAHQPIKRLDSVSIGIVGDFNCDGLDDLVTDMFYTPYEDIHFIPGLILGDRNNNFKLSAYLVQMLNFEKPFYNNNALPNQFTAIDYNKDGYSDILIYFPHKKNTQLFYGKPFKPVIWGSGMIYNKIKKKVLIYSIISDVEGIEDVERVSLKYEGLETGIYLNDKGKNGDLIAGDGIFTVEVKNVELRDNDKYLLEIEAEDSSGRISNKWPYLTVENYDHFKGFKSQPLFAKGIKRGIKRIGLILKREIKTKDKSGSNKPIIILTGYLNSHLIKTGGYINLLVLVYDEDGAEDVEEVELLKGGKKTGIKLKRIRELNISEKIAEFSYQVLINEKIKEGEYLLEFQAKDKEGNKSQISPYLMNN